MKYSEKSLRILAAKECGLIKTNAQFWRSYEDIERFNAEILDDDRIANASEILSKELEASDSMGGLICACDDGFPLINRNVRNKGEKPYLLFYRGDLSLLSDLNKNIAVIGLTDPDKEIAKRETEIVKNLVENNLTIVSGLAKGCDTIAHRTCLDTNGKTIAILPTQLGKIYPSENGQLADEIVEMGGLLISEYYKDAVSKYEAINRFIERDRLQAMFSKAIILIASYRKCEGDSGSRHAMGAASKYGIERYAMYNNNMDGDNKRFGLNKDLVSAVGQNQVKILMSSSIDEIKLLVNQNLSSEVHSYVSEQLTLL